MSKPQKFCREKTTQNLFWGKYSHSVCLQHALFKFLYFRNVLRSKNVDNALDYVNTQWPHADQSQIELIDMFEPIFKEVCTFRFQHSTMRIYHNSNSLNDLLLLKSPHIVVSCSKPLDDDHLTKLGDLSSKKQVFKKIRAVANPPKWKFKLCIQNLQHLHLDSNLMQMLDDYEKMEIISTTRVKYLRLLTRYSRGSIRVVDEGSATLIALALGPRYVTHIEERVCLFPQDSSSP